MQLVYALEELPNTITKSIFLAGPTPRNDDGNPWRIEAIKELERQGFDGVVFIPEPRDGSWHREYDRQVGWEDTCLNVADCIVFWVPRDLETIPAFTTNIEWGYWVTSGKVVLGYPAGTPKMTYMQYYANKLNIPVFESLSETLHNAIDRIKPEALRTGGERYVPLYIWRTPQFQSWYKAQVSAGNRLDGARVLYNFRPGNRNWVFMSILHCDVHVTSENRNKTNEFVISRTDISSIVLWNRQEPLLNSEIVLVREFRSPAATSDAMIRELPGGSSAKGNEDPLEVAAEEVHEETGFSIASSRLKFEVAKQLAGTLASHKSHLFSAEISDNELKYFKEQKDIVHGNVADSEMCYIEVVTLEQLLHHKVEVDWSTLGMILSVVLK